MLAAESRTVTAPAAVTLNLEPLVAWRQIVEPLEPFLQAVASRLEKQIKEFDPAIAPYAEYTLTGQGKQLRPALVALSAGATGKINDSHITVAIIIHAPTSMMHVTTICLDPNDPSVHNLNLVLEGHEPPSIGEIVGTSTQAGKSGLFLDEFSFSV